MSYAIDREPLWRPNPNTVGETRMAAFIQAMGQGDYAATWQWSVAEPAAFWNAIWDFCGAVGEKGEQVLLDENAEPCCVGLKVVADNSFDKALENP